MQIYILKHTTNYLLLLYKIVRKIGHLLILKQLVLFQNSLFFLLLSIVLFKKASYIVFTPALLNHNDSVDIVNLSAICFRISMT